MPCRARPGDFACTDPFSHVGQRRTPAGSRPGAGIGQAVAVDVVWVVLGIGLCAGLIYLGYRIEPHRVSKDGKRFLCTGQRLAPGGDTDGRKREVWITVLDGGQLQVDIKRRMHHDLSHWTLEGKAPNPPSGRAVYVLRTVNNLGALDRMAIRLPAKSKAVSVLDDVITNRAR